MKEKKENYVNNREFNDLLEEYFESEDPILYEKIGVIFLKIANRILCRPNFVNYPLHVKNDMVSEATFHMVKYIRTYKPEYENPFAFFSQTAFNAFRQILNKNTKHRDRYISLEYIENISRKSTQEN